MAPSLTSLLTLSQDFRDSTAASAAASFSNTEITTCLSLTTPLLGCLDDELRPSVWSNRGAARSAARSKLNESLIGLPSGNVYSATVPFSAQETASSTDRRAPSAQTLSARSPPRPGPAREPD